MAEAKGFTPPHLLDKPAACKVVIIAIGRLGPGAVSVAMSTYEVEGRVGYEGKLVRAIAEHSGMFRGAIRHEYYGDWSKLPRPSFKIVEEEVERKSKFEQGGTYKKKITKAVPAWEYWGAIEQGLGVTISATMAATGEEKSLDFDLVDAYPRNATTWPTRPKLQILNPAIRAFVNHCRSSCSWASISRTSSGYPGNARHHRLRPQQPQRRQPSKPTVYLKAYDAWGSEYSMQAGEVADWIANRCVDGSSGITAATADEIDNLIENNATSRRSRMPSRRRLRAGRRAVRPVAAEIGILRRRPPGYRQATTTLPRLMIPGHPAAVPSKAQMPRNQHLRDRRPARGRGAAITTSRPTCWQRWRAPRTWPRSSAS